MWYTWINKNAYKISIGNMKGGEPLGTNGAVTFNFTINEQASLYQNWIKPAQGKVQWRVKFLGHLCKY